MSDSSKATPQKKKNFLEKLIEILDNSDDTVVTWAPSGDTFIVVDTKRFSDEYLSSHFKSSNFSSFVRQLNFYGFHKLTGDKSRKDIWEFKHPKFHRDQRQLMAHIKRKTASDFSSSRGEIEDLKQEVVSLQAEVMCLRQQLQEAQSIIEAYQIEPQDPSPLVYSEIDRGVKRLRQGEQKFPANSGFQDFPTDFERLSLFDDATGLDLPSQTELPMSMFGAEPVRQDSTNGSSQAAATPSVSADTLPLSIKLPSSSSSLRFSHTSMASPRFALDGPISASDAPRDASEELCSEFDSLPVAIQQRIVGNLMEDLAQPKSDDACACDQRSSTSIAGSEKHASETSLVLADASDASLDPADHRTLWTLMTGSVVIPPAVLLLVLIRLPAVQTAIVNHIREVACSSATSQGSFAHHLVQGFQRPHEVFA